MFDLVQLAMIRACERFGSPNVFNAACFSHEFAAMAGVHGPLDGRIVAAILCGRDDVEMLSGGAHYRLIMPTED